MNNAENPLLSLDFPIDFSLVKAAHVEPAVAQLVSQAEAAMAAIGLPQPRTWETTMAAFDRFAVPLETAFAVARHLKEVATTAELRLAWNAAEPLGTAFFSRIFLDPGLWTAISEFAATDEARALTGPRRRFLDRTVAAFRRQGAALPPETKALLQEIDLELARLTTKFSENVLDSTNAFELVIEDEDGLAGLPISAIIMARENAESRGVRGWRFTLQLPSYLGLMTYLDDASVRERAYRAFNSRAARSPFANHDLVAQILDLRRRKANLLGYRDFASYVLDDRMAGTPDRAGAFLEDLLARTEPFFLRENEELAEFRRLLEGPNAGRLEPWDVAYYSEKLRKAKYDLDEEMLRPYFELDTVVAGMFELVQRLYGISIEERPASSWDPAVRYYEIRGEDGVLIGSFHADWFPRENKRGGAWMDNFLTGCPVPGGFLPHQGVMVGNMTPPSAGRPSLLTHREVETVFHEFGHLLHHCLSRAEIRGQAGINVTWDFVELPSQIMENWCWERPSLDLFARHYETGERLPDSLFDKLTRARAYRAANAQMRQLSFATLDLALHSVFDPATAGPVSAYAQNLLRRFSPAPIYDDNEMILSFNHLFSSPIGYAAGYYSYKWAEVLDADAFTAFRAEGIFNRATGLRFRREILEKGDSADPSELFRAFLGRDPSPQALLERAGLA